MRLFRPHDKLLLPANRKAPVRPAVWVENQHSDCCRSQPQCRCGAEFPEHLQGWAASKKPSDVILMTEIRVLEAACNQRNAPLGNPAPRPKRIGGRTPGVLFSDCHRGDRGGHRGGHASPPARSACAGSRDIQRLCNVDRRGGGSSSANGASGGHDPSNRRCSQWQRRPD